jgi:cytochrome c oxidase subunit 3
LLYTFILILKSYILPLHHFRFEAAAWYWHFVDVVWLFLFLSIYYWGGLTV